MMFPLTALYLLNFHPFQAVTRLVGQKPDPVEIFANSDSLNLNFDQLQDTGVHIDAPASRTVESSSPAVAAPVIVPHVPASEPCEGASARGPNNNINRPVHESIPPGFSSQYNPKTFVIAYREDTNTFCAKCPLHSTAMQRCTKSRKIQPQKGDTEDNVVKRLMLWCLDGSLDVSKTAHQREA